MARKESIVQVRVSLRERARWQAAAERGELTLSEFVRSAVREWMLRAQREAMEAQRK